MIDANFTARPFTMQLKRCSFSSYICTKTWLSVYISCITICQHTEATQRRITDWYKSVISDVCTCLLVYFSHRGI